MVTDAPDHTGRFSGRTDSYSKHRQGYEPEALALVAKYFGFAQDANLLDMGSGTGILTAQLLEQFPSANITAVEPNKDMREHSQSAPALEKYLSTPRLRIVAGSAEATTLPDHSCDAIFAAAAFHWFDGPRTRAEVLRIGAPSTSEDGQHGVPFIILTSNRERPAQNNTRGDPDHIDPSWTEAEHWRAFVNRLESFQRELAIDYTRRLHEVKVSPESVADFFGHADYKSAGFPRVREADMETMIGGLQSYSSVPPKGTPGYEKVVEGFVKLFNKWQKDGKIKIVGEMMAYYGYVVD